MKYTFKKMLVTITIFDILTGVYKIDGRNIVFFPCLMMYDLNLA